MRDFFLTLLLRRFSSQWITWPDYLNRYLISVIVCKTSIFVPLINRACLWFIKDFRHIPTVPTQQVFKILTSSEQGELFSQVGTASEVARSAAERVAAAPGNFLLKALLAIEQNRGQFSDQFFLTTLEKSPIFLRNLLFCPLIVNNELFKIQISLGLDPLIMNTLS